MRQKKMIIAALAAMLLAIPAMVQSKKGEAAKAKALEISFDYQRQAGPGSNQYAVWIENEKGDVVKTLFVTSYTTKGRARGGEQPKRGYIVRPACVPTWVKTVKADEKTDQQLDAVTGATPQAGGTQTFTWDFTDEQGKTVPQGNYKVIVEATLFFDSDIIYSGTFSTKDKAGDIKLADSDIIYSGTFSTKDKEGDIKITSTLTKEDEQHKNMVTNIKAVLK